MINIVEHTRQGDMIMNHEVIKRVILDQHDVISIKIVFIRL